MSEIQEYQDWTVDTALYPGVGTGSHAALSYIGLGLGEAGEVQGKIKKVIRDDKGILTDKAREDIIKEAGDLLWYLARLFDEIDTTFEEVAAINKKKLIERRDKGSLGGSGDDR